jgi:hypothetical protein
MEKFTDETTEGPSFVYNKIEGNSALTDKKNLFLNLVDYYNHTGESILNAIPLTFLIKKGPNDESFEPFRTACETEELWIVKPGECSNRGNGIRVCQDIDAVRSYMVTNPRNTYIV